MKKPTPKLGHVSRDPFDHITWVIRDVIGLEGLRKYCIERSITGLTRYDKEEALREIDRVDKDLLQIDKRIQQHIRKMSKVRLKVKK